MNTCCELCKCVHADLPNWKEHFDACKEARYCHDHSCECHQEKPTHEIGGWEKEIRSILLPGELVKDLEDQIVFQIKLLLTHQKESIVSKLEGLKRSQEKILTDMTFTEEQTYNQGIADAIEVVREI